MTPNDYQQAALRTAPKDLPPDRLLLNGLMGLNGEAGEAIDILKKHHIWLKRLEMWLGTLL